MGRVDGSQRVLYKGLTSVGKEFSRATALRFPAPQVFNVFNRVLGFFIRSKRIDFDDDWEEKSELAGNGARLLRCAFDKLTTAKAWSRSCRPT
jgi:hypothetical protein